MSVVRVVHTNIKYPCLTNVPHCLVCLADHFIQFIWNKWSRWEVKMSWCEYSTFYTIYLSESNFSTFYFDSRSETLEHISFNMERVMILFYVKKILNHFLFHPFKIVKSSPTIISAIKTKARHFPSTQYV